MPVYNFRSSLAIGKAGEAIFANHFPMLTPLNGRKSDFIDQVSKELWELKTDSYDMAKTKNFFIEHYSDIERGKLGGIWQSATHGTTYWCYMFSKNETLFVFILEDLVAFMEKTLLNYEIREIKNKTWVTTGFLVPREAVQHLAWVINLQTPIGGTNAEHTTRVD